MKLGDRLEEVLAEGETDDLVREHYTFGYPSWYLALKIMLFAVAGLFVLYTAGSPRTSGSLLARLILAGAGLWFLGLAISVMRGLRQITIEGSSLRAVYGTGRRVSWTLGKLQLSNAKREMAWSGSVTVRAYPECSVAFRLPRDFPSWRRIVELIAGNHAHA